MSNTSNSKISIDFDDLTAEQEKHFFDKLRESLIVLMTTSPDKRTQFTSLFTSGRDDSDRQDHHKHSLNAHFTTGGDMGVDITKTDEATNDYRGNLDEKAHQTLRTLQNADINHLINERLNTSGNSVGLNGINPDKINKIGMTEDSGWTLAIGDKEKRADFYTNIKEIISPKLDTDQQWLLEKIEQTGFPGPNFKPLQEALMGSFDELMMDIYAAAEKSNIDSLRYKHTSDLAFSLPEDNMMVSRSHSSFGNVISKEQYLESRNNIPDKETLNTDIIQAPDGASNPQRQTFDKLKQAVLTDFSNDLDIDNPRRNHTLWLQENIGFRRTKSKAREETFDIAIVSPETLEGGKASPPSVTALSDMKIISVPSKSSLVEHGDLQHFNTADGVVLVPNRSLNHNSSVHVDPNLEMLVNILVTKETDPKSMNTPIILDNRNDGFNNVIEYLQHVYLSGRAIGDSPILIANDDKEMTDYLTTIKKIKQSSPLTSEQYSQADAFKKTSTPIDLVPNDGTPTFFVGGGHHNNAPKDLREAHDLGYELAKEDCRIITGAGCLEGSMGATHTGFMQYHLDQIKENLNVYNALDASTKKDLDAFYDVDTKKFDAKKIIKNAPEIINALADISHEGKPIIPKDKFYGYSMDSLVKLESSIGAPPPGITYKESENREVRLTGLLSSGNKIIMPGSIGTDEELLGAIKQHQEGFKIANNSSTIFADGVNDNDGKIIIYNRDGVYDKLLQNLDIAGESPLAKQNRESNKITVVSSVKELKEAVSERINKLREDRSFTDAIDEEKTADHKRGTRR